MPSPRLPLLLVGLFRKPVLVMAGLHSTRNAILSLSVRPKCRGLRSDSRIRIALAIIEVNEAHEAALTPGERTYRSQNQPAGLSWRAPRKACGPSYRVEVWAAKCQASAG